MARTIAGPGELGSIKAMKKSLKKSGQANIKTIPGEDSLTVRFLEEPDKWHGYYEHWLSSGPIPCTTDECEGCDSDDEEERRKSFRYLANAYIVDDQKVWALKMPKTLVEMLMAFYTRYKGTILDRDYELSRTGSGINSTKYMAVPDERSKMNLERFDKKKFDLHEVLSQMVNDAESDDDDDDGDEDDVPRKKKSSKSKPKKRREDPWEDDDEPVRRKKKSAPKKRPTKRTTSRSSSVRKRPVKKTVKRRR